MNPLELRADLCRRGVDLMLVDGKVRTAAPRGTLTDADREAIKAHKPALLQLLARAVTVYAPALGCDVLCVETLEDIPDGYAGPVYTRAELERMRGLPPGDVRTIHELNQEWGGEYEGRSDNLNPPTCNPGDRVRGYDGERWKVGTVLYVLEDNGWTVLDAVGRVMVQLDDTTYETVFKRERLWSVESDEPVDPSR